MQHLTKPLIVFLLLALLPVAGFTQEPDEAPKPPKLFASNEILDVTLKGPWRRVMKQKSSPEKYAGTLEYTVAGGKTVSFPIGITTRGLTRRDQVCAFPPLKLWFDKEQVKGTAFRGQSSLKMVTYCNSNSRYEQYNVKEYLAYRIYNLITPYSFRVRPMQVNHVDSERDGKEVDFFGFLLEDIDDVAKRNGLVELEISRVSKKRLDSVETSNYVVYQYLIGNLDWSAQVGPDPDECCHNSKLIGTGPEDSPVFVIPYDLDSTGLVNAHYARPPNNLRVRRITQRLYRGYCIHNSELPATLGRFRENREAILGLFRDEPLLTDRSRSTAIKYLEDFYESVNEPEDVEKLLIGKCRQ